MPDGSRTDPFVVTGGSGSAELTTAGRPHAAGDPAWYYPEDPAGHRVFYRWTAPTSEFYVFGYVGAQRTDQFGNVGTAYCHVEAWDEASMTHVAANRNGISAGASFRGDVSSDPNEFRFVVWQTVAGTTYLLRFASPVGREFSGGSVHWRPRDPSIPAGHPTDFEVYRPTGWSYPQDALNNGPGSGVMKAKGGQLALSDDSHDTWVSWRPTDLPFEQDFDQIVNTGPKGFYNGTSSRIDVLFGGVDLRNVEQIEVLFTGRGGDETSTIPLSLRVDGVTPQPIPGGIVYEGGIGGGFMNLWGYRWPNLREPTHETVGVIQCHSRSTRNEAHSSLPLAAQMENATVRVICSWSSGDNQFYRGGRYYSAELRVKHRGGKQPAISPPLASKAAISMAGYLSHQLTADVDGTVLAESGSYYHFWGQAHAAFQSGRIVLPYNGGVYGEYGYCLGFVLTPDTRHVETVVEWPWNPFFDGYSHETSVLPNRPGRSVLLQAFPALTRPGVVYGSTGWEAEYPVTLYEVSEFGKVTATHSMGTQYDPEHETYGKAIFWGGVFEDKLTYLAIAGEGNADASNGAYGDWAVLQPPVGTVLRYDLKTDTFDPPLVIDRLAPADDTFGYDFVHTMTVHPLTGDLWWLMGSDYFGTPDDPTAEVHHTAEIALVQTTADGQYLARYDFDGGSYYPDARAFSQQLGGSHFPPSVEISDDGQWLYWSSYGSVQGDGYDPVFTESPDVAPQWSTTADGYNEQEGVWRVHMPSLTPSTRAPITNSNGFATQYVSSGLNALGPVWLKIGGVYQASGLEPWCSVPIGPSGVAPPMRQRARQDGLAAGTGAKRGASESEMRQRSIRRGPGVVW